MPNDYSNFTLPDTGSADAGKAAPPGYVWDGTRWMPKSTAPATPFVADTAHPDARAWGGYGPSTDANGRDIPGTSGGDKDYARFGRMANEGQYGAVQIDQGASNETRGIQGGAIGMLRARAGGAETPADVLARQQTAGAVAGIQSGAASIKGGAGTRAAAARGAIATGARVQATGDQDAAALHARGIADAAGQYFGAATSQRGQDLGIATAQSQLEAQQRAANDQHKLHYDQAAFNVGNAQNSATLGVSGQDQAAENAARTQQRAADAVTRQQVQTGVSGGVGAVTGAVGAYNNTTAPAPTPKPYDPNHTDSDERMKMDVHPVGHDKGAQKTPRDRLRSNANKAGANYDGKYLPPAIPSEADQARDKSFAAWRDGPEKPSPLLLGAEMAKSAEGGSERGDPYTTEPHQDRLLFGAAHRREGYAPGSYAAERAGPEGGMFGTQPEPSYSDGRKSDATFFGAGNQGDAGRRDIAMSDPKAKAEAYRLGISHANAAANDPDLPEPTPPSYVPSTVAKSTNARVLITKGPHTAPGKEDAYAQAHKPGEGPVAGPAPSTVKSDPAKVHERATWDNAHRPGEGPPAEMLPPQPWSPLPPPQSPLVNYAGAPDPYEAAHAPGAGPPAIGPSYFGRLAASTRTMTSDKDAKTNIHGDPMAAANRSMAPFSYEYKPEFTPPEQQPGEENVGPMANKMKANPIAKTAIVEDPKTSLLAIDKTKGLKLVMGGLADLQRQVDRMRGHA